MKNIVRAKFMVTEVTRYASDRDSAVVKMSAVVGPENAEWSKYTPIGGVHMNVKGNAAEVLALGKEFYVDFVSVEG